MRALIVCVVLIDLSKSELSELSCDFDQYSDNGICNYESVSGRTVNED